MSYVPLQGEGYEYKAPPAASAPLMSADSFNTLSVPLNPNPVTFNPSPTTVTFGQNPTGAPGSAVYYESQPYPGYAQYQGPQPVYQYPGYSAQGQPINQPVSWGRNPQDLQCYHCKQFTRTNIHYTTGAANILACFGIALIGCFCGCCLIPFCIDSMKDVEHRCQHCGKFLHTKQVLF